MPSFKPGGYKMAIGRQRRGTGGCSIHLIASKTAATSLKRGRLGSSAKEVPRRRQRQRRRRRVRGPHPARSRPCGPQPRQDLRLQAGLYAVVDGVAH